MLRREKKMTKKLGIAKAVAMAFLTAWGVSGIALAVDEVEHNDPVGFAQHLVIGSDGTAEVSGFMGDPLGDPIRDVDFYSFEGKEGDVVTVDIDGGTHADGTGVDTVVAIFGPNGTDALFLYAQVDDPDPGTPLDEGSMGPQDARIDNFTLPVTGTYVIGVVSYPASFTDVNTLATYRLDEFGSSIGAYTLRLSGVKPPIQPPAIQQVKIDIKPGERGVAPIHLQSKVIPVALLSSPAFDALQVDRASLKFGETGTEASLLRCHKEGIDVNRDGTRDLVCLFDTAKTKFERGDTEGVLTGKTASGASFEGRGWLKVVVEKRRHDRHEHRDRDHDRDHDHRK